MDYAIDGWAKLLLCVHVNSIKSSLEKAALQITEILASMKITDKPMSRFEQLELPFGGVSEFEVNQSVRRKVSNR